MDSLVERLQHRKLARLQTPTKLDRADAALDEEAIDRITELEAEVERLRESLQPFADVAGYYDLESEPDDFNLLSDLGHRHITRIMKLGLFRSARAALEGEKT